MQTKTSAVIILPLIAILIAVSLRFGNGEEAPRSQDNQQAHDLRKHPIYSSYRFERNERIIHFGSQPLTVFMGNLGALMRRDTILHDELARIGYEIRIHSFFKGYDLGFFLRRGDIHGGMLGDMPTIRLAASTETIIPALSGEGWASIVAKRRALLSTLKGKRVGIAFGSSAHYILLDALQSVHLNSQDIRPVFMEGDRMPKALERGEIDAFSGWEPQVSVALNLVRGSSVVHRGRYAGFTCFQREFAEKHPEAVQHILAAQVRALRYLWGDNKGLGLSCRWAVEESRKLAGPSYDVSPDLLEKIISHARNMNIVPIIPETDLKQNGHLESTFAFLKGLGFIPAATEWKSLIKSFDRSRMIRVLTNPQRYRLSESKYDTGAKP